MSNACRHVTLARNGVAHVQRCSDCGCISVHLGPMSVRLDDVGFAGLVEALETASEELQDRRPDRKMNVAQRGVA